MKCKKDENINPNVQRRIINFVNNAKHIDDITKKIKVDKKVAQCLLSTRDLDEPFGFRDLNSIIKIVGDQVFAHLTHLFGAHHVGEWETPFVNDTPDSPPVHAALLRTGRVLFIPHGHFAHVPDTFVWDPTVGDDPSAFSLTDNQPDDNLYCSGHSFLSGRFTGQLLVVGGGGAGPNDVNRAWRFNPMAGTNGSWSRTAGDMTNAQWYPTVVTLGGGRVFVVGGRPNNSKVEVYDEHTDSFTSIAMPVERSFPQTYPGLHLLPGNQILYTRTGFGNAGPGSHSGDPVPGTPYFQFTGASSGEWVDIADTMSSPNRVKGMSVTLLLGPFLGSYFTKVMVVGGNGNDTAETINLSAISPTWEPPTTIPGGGRSNVNVVVLPDNTVFVCGGATPTNSAILPCALYDPMTNSWSEMDSLSYRRAYHSVAILLPSGQVMITGDVNQKIEIFNPPYLFKGARPEISSFPDVVHHARNFDVETPQASDIEKVVLVRPIAVTHQTDTEQRVVGLTFNREGSVLHVTAPNGNHPHPMAPRGYYMLFIINNDGVPSVGKFILLH